MIRNINKIHLLILNICLLILFFLILFSPVISLSFAILILAFTNNISKRWFRLLVGILYVVSWGLITASRGLLLATNDDFISYYSNYKSIANGELESIFEYGSGIEIGIPIIFYLLSLFSGDINPSLLVFIMVTLAGLLFIFWIEYKDKDNLNKGLETSFTLVLCALFMSAQLVRQFYSDLILLYALLCKNIIKKYILFGVAVMFHTTAVPIYILIVTTIKYRIKAIIAYAIIFIIFLFSFQEIINLNMVNDTIGLNKLTYYIDNSDGFLASKNLKYLLIYSIPILFIIINILIEKNFVYKYNDWIFVYFLFYFIYLILLPIPGLGYRITLLMNSILLGLVLFKSININKNMFFLLIIALVILRFNSLITQDPSNLMRYWINYDFFSYVPGYYLNYLFF